MEAATDSVVIASPVIHAWGTDLDGAGAEGDLPGSGLAVANDLGSAMLVSFLVASKVVGDLGFERLCEHAPGSLAGDLIQPGGVGRVPVVAADLDEVGHSAWSSFREIVRTDTRCYPVRSRLRPPNPQLLVIAL